MRLLVSLSILAWCISSISANVEKAVFLAPEVVHNLDQLPGLNQLSLAVLNPSNWTFRTHLAASFPTPDSLLGTEAWFLLDGLSHHRRYEVRLCWSATVFSLSISANVGIMHSTTMHQQANRYANITSLSTN